MQSINYEQVLENVERLERSDQVRLLEEISNLVRPGANPGRRRSVLELRGLGKSIWQKINIGEYIAKERDSWDG